MKIRTTLFGVAAAASMAGASLMPVLAANPFANGSFEDGPNPGVFATKGTGDETIDGWKVTDGSIDHIGSYWQHANGDRSVDLSGNTAGTIEQTFVTMPGGKYTVNFMMSGNPDNGPGLKEMTASADGESQPFSYLVTAANSKVAMNWEARSFDFTADDEEATLSFASNTNSAFGPALDAVVVTQLLPETKDDCKKGGWEDFGVFKNQGDCVSYVATGGSNAPAGAN